MRFLVIGIDPATGAATSVVESVLPTREQALAAVKDMASSGEGWIEGYDLYLVDLDVATPVILLRSPSPPSVPSEPVEQPITSELEPVVYEEPEAAFVPAVPQTQPPVPEPSLDADGLQASDISVAAPSADLEPPAAPAALGEEAFAATQEVEPESEPDEQDLLEALRRAADSLVQQGVEVPEPPAAVLAEAALPDVLAPDEAPAPEPSVSVAEPLGAVEATVPASEASGIAPEPLSEIEPVRPVIMGEYPEDIPEPAVSSLEESKPYEPSGELEIEAYTCKDCVYFNTCPKAGESTPAECGTFQWRSF